MEGFRKRVYGRPATTCRYWRQGRCNRSPCDFLHSEAPSTEIPVRKRLSPSDDDDHREKKRYTWKRNQIEDSVNPADKIAQKEEPAKNAESGSGFKLVAELVGHKNVVTGACLPTGSNKLFSGSKDGCLRVWDCNTGQCDFNVGVGCEIGCIISEPPLLFVGLENGVNVYNLDDQTQFHLSGANGLVRCLTFDDTSHTLYGGVEDGSVIAWKKATPESSLPVVVATYKGHQQAVLSLFIAKDAIFSASQDKTIRALDPLTLDCWLILNDHTDSVTCLLCWETYMITGSLDKTVKLWGNAEDGTLQVVCQVKDESGVLAMLGIYDQDNNPTLLCSRNDNTISLLSLPTLTEKGRICTKAAVHTISAIPEMSNRLFFTGEDTGQISVWRWMGSNQMKNLDQKPFL